MPEPPAIWRAMVPADLPAVARIAEEVHPAFPEGDAVFAERLRLYPAGAYILDRDGAPLGYAISHPWRSDSLPALDTLFGALPSEADLYYLHDLALLPTARSTGAGGRIVATIARHARAAGFAAIRLIAVNGSVPFWQRQGFAVETPPGPLADHLASYGPDARLMRRRSGAT